MNALTARDGMRPSRQSSLSMQTVSGLTGHIPPLNQLMDEGKAVSDRIKKLGTNIQKMRESRLLLWFEQAERLWIAAEHHKLKGQRFHAFADRIGVDRSSAYELLKLHPHRERVLEQCRRDNHWPGWKDCADWIREDGPADPYRAVQMSRRGGFVFPKRHSDAAPNDEYGTPQALFEYYNRIHHFTCDVAASHKLAKCRIYYTKEADGLKQRWTGVCWMNPPYSNLRPWIKKAYESAQQGATVVALLPAYTDTVWFHEYAKHAASIEFLRGRLLFAGKDGYSPFATMICVFRKQSARPGYHIAASLSGHRLGTEARRKSQHSKSTTSCEGIGPPHTDNGTAGGEALGGG